MPYKVITNDKEQRKGFKERTLERVDNALSPSEPDPIVEEVDPIEVRVPSNFWELSNQELYGIIRQQQLTPEQMGLLMDQLRGRVLTDMFKIVLQEPVVEEPVVEETSVETPTICAELPSNFKSFRVRDQYLYLTKERTFAPEHANDIIDILQGKAPLANVEYSICFEDAVVSEPSVPAPLSITLPHDFSGMKRVYQELMLTRDYGLSLKDTMDILLALEGKELNREIVLEFEEAPVVEEEVKEFAEVVVSLPEHFSNWHPHDQFLYLKSERKFTQEQADDIIATVRGQSPRYFKVVIE